MKKFMVIGYTTQEGFDNLREMTKEQQEKSMNNWFAWKEKIGEHLVDMGTPLMNGTKLSDDGQKEPSIREVSGYMMIRADNMDEAFELILDSPLNAYGSGNTFEIYECLKM